MHACGSLLYWNLLALGACSSLSPRCGGEVDRQCGPRWRGGGLVDATFALQADLGYGGVVGEIEEERLGREEKLPRREQEAAALSPDRSDVSDLEALTERGSTPSTPEPTTDPRPPAPPATPSPTRPPEPTLAPTPPPTERPPAPPATPSPTRPPAPTLAPTPPPTERPPAPTPAPSPVMPAATPSPTPSPTERPPAPTPVPSPMMPAATPSPTPSPTAGVTYASKLSFVLTGLDYAALAADAAAAAALRALAASGVCGAVARPEADCAVALSAGSVQVQVTIAQNSLADAQAATADLSASAASITGALLASAESNVDIMAHSTGALAAQDVVATTETDGATAIGDPHLSTITGKRFDVNMPGSYVLIRAPLDRRLPAMLELNASLQPLGNGPCGLYIESLALGGQWLGGRVVRVVPLRRNAVGPNGAGNRTLRPFSMRVQDHRGDSHAASGKYEQWGDIRAGGRSLSGRVRIVPVWRQLYADAGRAQEAQAFQFHIRGAGSGYETTFEAAQAAHQALDFRAGGLRSLGFQQLGGLLGTEEHDQRVERVADTCKEFRMKSMRSRMSGVMSSSALRTFNGQAKDEGSKMVASWDELF